MSHESYHHQVIWFSDAKEIETIFHKGRVKKFHTGRAAAWSIGHEGEKHPMGLQAVMIDVF